jgi:hypothetical protein
MKQNDTYRKKSGVANSGSNAGVMQLCYFFLNSKKYCNNSAFPDIVLVLEDVLQMVINQNIKLTYRTFLL